VVRIRNIRSLIWKELIDLSRDRRTLLSTILVPLIFLPALGLVIQMSAQTQPVSIAIIDYDNTNYSRRLMEIIELYVKWYGKLKNTPVNIARAFKDNESLGLNIDLIVIINKGFEESMKRLNGSFTIILKPNPISFRWGEITSYINAAINHFESEIVNKRILYLSSLAHVTVDVEKFRNPIDTKLEFQVVPGVGVVAGEQPAYLYLTLMVLIIGLFLSMSPPVAFIADSVAGERERRTLEALLVTPASRGEILFSKLFSSLILGSIAAIASTVGAYLMYHALFSGIGGAMVSIPLPVNIVGVFAVTVFLTVLLTLSIALLISSISDSVRAAQSNSYAVITVASLVMFASLFVDIDRIGEPYKTLLMFIPYTHSLLSISRFLKSGSVIEVLPYWGILAAFTIIFLIATMKMFNSERIIVGGSIILRRKRKRSS